MSEEAFFGEDPPTPYEPVGWLSRFVEKVSEQYVRKASSPETVIALRPTSIYGPHDDFEFETCHALPAMIRRVVERHHPIEVWGSGEDGRDLLYVGDLVDACMLALERCNGFSAYNVGAGASSTIFRSRSSVHAEISGRSVLIMFAWCRSFLGICMANFILLAITSTRYQDVATSFMSIRLVGAIHRS